MPPTNDGWIYRDRVQRRDDGRPVLDFYALRYPHSSRQTWLSRLSAGQIRLDGRPVAAKDRLAAGQNLSYHRPPWTEPAAPCGFAVLYEDADLVAVAKPSGLPVLPGGQFLQRTLLALVRRRYGATAAPLHRLGRATSGIVLFARTPTARRALSAAFRQGRLRKTYRALAAGIVCPDRFSVDVPIGPVPYAPLGRLHAAAADGKPSRTHCRVLRRDVAKGQSLLEVEIPTGRPHQIRIHLAAAGHPLVGDPLYIAGGHPRPPTTAAAALPGDGGYALHAARLTLAHPVSGRDLLIGCHPPPLLR